MKRQKQGDPKALKIYAEAAYEFSLVVKALIGRLDFKQDETILVSYSGGVFKAGRLHPETSQGSDLSRRSQAC